MINVSWKENIQYEKIRLNEDMRSVFRYLKTWGLSCRKEMYPVPWYLQGAELGPLGYKFCLNILWINCHLRAIHGRNGLSQHEFVQTHKACLDRSKQKIIRAPAGLISGETDQQPLRLKTRVQSANLDPRMVSTEQCYNIDDSPESG